MEFVRLGLDMREDYDYGGFHDDDEEEDDVDMLQPPNGREDAVESDADSNDDPDSNDDAEGNNLTDTTAAEARRGKDIQGIQWDRLLFTREKYRETRLQQYKNYENLNQPHDQLEQESLKFEKGGMFYSFRHNTRAVKPTVVHFQLRNLVWATSKHDVYVMHSSQVLHWSPLTRKSSGVLSVSGPIVPSPEAERSPWVLQQGVRQVQISTMCVKDNFLVAGGFQGEMICQFVDRPGVSYCAQISQDENAITNAIEIYQSPSGAARVMTANNDSVVRVFDTERFVVLGRYYFHWAVNHTSVSPDKKLLVVVGDHTDGLLADNQTGKVVSVLKGHLDYSFASAWHPDGNIFATGNQDTTCRLWDVRKPDSALAVLKGRIGAIRSLRFTSDGRFLAMAEPADFVHVFDVERGFCLSQEIDIFGEIAGISFSPDTETLFVGVADRTYGSLLEFNKSHVNTYTDSVI